jgi:hypothetical protein
MYDQRWIVGIGGLKHKMSLEGPEASEHKGVFKPGDDDITSPWRKVPINKEQITMVNAGSLHGVASNL